MSGRFEISAAACMLMLGCSLAQPGRMHVDNIDMAYLASAVTWDRNKDGVVTCDEWRDYLEELLNQSDTSKDGKLTRAELAAFSSIDRLFAVADFNYFDIDKNGVIDRAELFGKANPAFKSLDKDKDCVLTAEELAGARQFQHPGPPSGMPPGGPGKGGFPGGKQ